MTANDNNNNEGGQAHIFPNQQQTLAPLKLEPKPETDVLENLVTEDKLVMSNTLSTLFPEAEKIFLGTSEDKLKGGIGFPKMSNLDDLISALDESVTLKILQFFHSGQK